MKRVLVAGLGVALMAAVSPVYAAPPPGPAAAATAPNAAPPPAPEPDGAAPPPPPDQQADGAMPPPPPPPGGPGRRGPPPPPSPAAHFRFSRGDGVIDIKCADNEPTRVCVENVMVLIDHLPHAPKP